MSLEILSVAVLSLKGGGSGRSGVQQRIGFI